MSSATRREDLPVELQDLVARLIGEGVRTKYLPILTLLQQARNELPEHDPVREILTEAARAVATVIVQA